VDVRILIPGKVGHYFVELASLTYYNDMKKFGVKIFRYQEKFLHQKVFIADAGFVEELSRVLETDFECSILVEPDYFNKLGLPKKVAARVARLASPLL
jgi:hypothetical protein